MTRLSLIILILTGLATSGYGDDGTQSAVFADRDQRYVLQPNDVVEVHYRYTPEYNQTVAVQPDGYVTLLLVGGVKFGGKTIEEARETLQGMAAIRLRDPEVDLVLKEFERPYFVVAGQVEEPGRFDMRVTVSVIEAIAMAGGFTDKAKHSQVVLVRKMDDTLGETRLLDMKRMMEAPYADEAIVLRSGDLLIVPQSKFSKIERVIKLANVGLFVNPL